ncbi:hypothetical protein CYLTODRAFT_457427 [Cylindrobasidium torrendii FP15055 ss-10]|uniref:Uncharacterized protein n=1 Tax=Cylindrobasidium torrendii FP15055 ss-10 TaxID=1314674 RepID=A0A0D7B222_9AGAR|nr:hypothetical protein CYLTODRAFT_457427 [Cylindrobasidium torrendii FP15055 ss-10]
MTQKELSSAVSPYPYGFAPYSRSVRTFDRERERKVDLGGRDEPYNSDDDDAAFGFDQDRRRVPRARLESIPPYPPPTFLEAMSTPIEPLSRRDVFPSANYAEPLERIRESMASQEHLESRPCSRQSQRACPTDSAEEQQAEIEEQGTAQVPEQVPQAEHREDNHENRAPETPTQPQEEAEAEMVLVDADNVPKVEDTAAPASNQSNGRGHWPHFDIMRRRSRANLLLKLEMGGGSGTGGQDGETTPTTASTSAAPVPPTPIATVPSKRSKTRHSSPLRLFTPGSFPPSTSSLASNSTTSLQMTSPSPSTALTVPSTESLIPSPEQEPRAESPRLAAPMCPLSPLRHATTDIKPKDKSPLRASALMLSPMTSLKGKAPSTNQRSLLKRWVTHKERGKEKEKEKGKAKEEAFEETHEEKGKVGIKEDRPTKQEASAPLQSNASTSEALDTWEVVGDGDSSSDQPSEDSFDLHGGADTMSVLSAPLPSSTSSMFAGARPASPGAASMVLMPSEGGCHCHCHHCMPLRPTFHTVATAPALPSTPMLAPVPIVHAPSIGLNDTSSAEPLVLPMPASPAPSVTPTATRHVSPAVTPRSEDEPPSGPVRELRNVGSQYSLRQDDTTASVPESARSATPLRESGRELRNVGSQYSLRSAATGDISSVQELRRASSPLATPSKAEVSEQIRPNGRWTGNGNAAQYSYRPAAGQHHYMGRPLPPLPSHSAARA